MVRTAGPSGPGIYTATYSNIPVYEYQFGDDLKEHVMRRRHDDWINATHILKAAGFDKPARTRILEREVQKEMHEKVQGGYGKYQGTWVPLEQGHALAQRNNVYEKLRPIFEFIPGNVSPPPAPKHSTNKPKAPKKPAVPRWGNVNTSSTNNRVVDEPYDMSSQLNDEEDIPDDTTVASASFMGDDDRYDISQQSTGHRKRKREEQVPNVTEQAHVVYSDELLDYFMLSGDATANITWPEPPPNFQPDWLIDQAGHSAMHWAAAMGDLEVMRQMKRFGANLASQNMRGETPLMRAVLFTNCKDKQSFPEVLKELMGTIDAVDYCQATVLHHAAMMTASSQKHACARYYLDIIMNEVVELLDPDHLQRLLDARDIDGNTAVHIAANFRARKCVRALMGRGASTDIENGAGVTAAQLIQELNQHKQADQERHLQHSSSPFAPAMPQHSSFQEAIVADTTRHAVSHHSEAAMSIEHKVTPQILQKFQALAHSFDDELVDKDQNEKEAKRILALTNMELANVRDEIIDHEVNEVPSEAKVERVSELSRLQADIISVIEQQQHLKLQGFTQQDEGNMNGHGIGDDELAERLHLAQMIGEQQSHRQQLLTNYHRALSMAGTGDKPQMYRDLITKCVDVDVDSLDVDLDLLIDQLTEDQATREDELVISNDL